MATGKNKLLRFCRAYFGGYDLSGDSRTFGALANSVGEIEIGGWSETAMNYVTDARRTIGLDGYQTIVNDTAGRSFARLKDAPQAHVITIALGGGAAPAAGDVAYVLPGMQLDGVVTISGGIATLSSVNAKASASTIGANYYQPFGKVLLPLTALTATTNGTGVNFLTGSAGWGATLHITVSSGGTWSYVLQSSATGAYAGEEATLGTFTANGSTVTAEFLSGSANISGYVRLRAVRTSGTCSVFCALTRNY